MQTAKLRRYFLLIFFAVTASGVSFGATLHAAAPVQVIRTLDSLKNENNLTEWLYLRVDHSYNNPGQRLSFLMDTQKEMWRQPKSIAEKEAYLILLSNQAYALLYTGKILESIHYYEQSYNYFIAHKLNVGGIAEYVFKPWANNYTRLGDYEKALFIQKRTLEYALKEKDGLLAAASYNNMAISYRSLGDFKSAEACIKSGLAILSPSSQIKILLNNTLADIYKDSGRLSKAEMVITNNILAQKKRPAGFETAYWLLSSYITAGDIALLRNNFKRAQEFYKQALLINDKHYNGNRRREQAYVITQLGSMQLKQHNTAAATDYFNQTLSVLGLLRNGRVSADRIFGDNRLIDVFYLKGLAALRSGDEKAALKNIRYSLLAADKIRLELADVTTKQRFQADTKVKAEKAIEIAFMLLEKTRQYQYALVILDIMEQSKARTLLEDIRNNQRQLTSQTKDTLFTNKQALEKAIAYHERELLQNPIDREQVEKNIGALKFRLGNIEKVLRGRYPSMNTDKNPKNLTSTSILKKIPGQQHIIQFFVGQSAVYALEVTEQKISYIKKIKHADRLKRKVSDFVEQYYQNGPGAMISNPQDFYNASYLIYHNLLGELKIGNDERIVIIPDEALGYLSFEGLITEGKYSPAISGWPFLIKKSSISYAFSIQTLLNQSQKRLSSGQQFAGLFITHQHKNKQFIPAVAKEAASIKQIISGSYLMDENAGVKDFLKAFDNAKVLHISTHSYLTGVQKTPTLALNDNELFLFELSSRKNTPSLVVLSACQTADGMMAKGEGIISLSRGFAAIGAQSTIAGLWNVNDEAASIITSEMYQHMLNGATTATALHDAKLQWLREARNGEQEYLPYYWDSLIFMGYDQQLTLKPAAGPIQRYLLYIGLAAFIFWTIWFVLKRLRLKAEYLAK